MSILEANKIDMIGVPSDNPANVVVLGITDHLTWIGGDEYDHLMLLQEKLNHYIAFIESGEINVAFPAAVGLNPVIRLLAKFEPSAAGKEFISVASATLMNAGVRLQLEVG